MTVIIEDSDEIARAALEKTYKKQGFGVNAVFQAPSMASADARVKVSGSESEQIYFTKPVRAGAVLATALRLDGARAGASEYISFGGYRLNTVSHELTDKKGERLRLTEKESHILRLLAEQPGQVIGRKALLETVWQYAENAETHTLETHIYRLRRKIEPDPANPSLLLTEETGYRLIT